MDKNTKTNSKRFQDPFSDPLYFLLWFFTFSFKLSLEIGQIRYPVGYYHGKWPFNLVHVCDIDCRLWSFSWIIIIQNDKNKHDSRSPSWVINPQGIKIICLSNTSNVYNISSTWPLKIFDTIRTILNFVTLLLLWPNFWNGNLSILLLLNACYMHLLKQT